MKIEIIDRPFKIAPVAAQQLDHFVFAFDPRSDVLPKLINPAQVAGFISQHLAKTNLDQEEASQIGGLADFYDIKQRVGDFLKTLVRQEMTEQRFLVAVAFTQTVGILSEGEEWAQGRDYFRFLLSSRYARTRMPELLMCLNDYTPGEDQKATSDRINRLTQTLAAQAEVDPGAGVDLRNLEDMQSNSLPRIAKAAEIKKEILAIQDASARLDRLVMIYLKFSMEYHEWLDRWAVRSLLREYYRNGAVEPVKAFRRALEKIDKLGASDEDGRTLKKVCYHAIDFFGGRLDEKERGEAQELAPHLAGSLSLDKGTGQ